MEVDNLNKSSENIKPRINKSRETRRQIHLLRLRVMAKYNRLSPEDEQRIDRADELTDADIESRARLGTDKLLARLKEFHG